MFESIKSLRPFFHSLREIENNVSLDIKIPLSWKFEDIVKPYRSLKIKVQDKNEKFTLVSLIATSTMEGYEVVLACALEVIKINKEEEEKRRLFIEKQKRLQEEYNLKVKELEERFKSEPLDKLKDLDLLNEYGKGFDEIGDGMVAEGDEEGRERDIDLQGENDRGDKTTR